jgi:hypothetical protein
VRQAEWWQLGGSGSPAMVAAMAARQQHGASTTVVAAVALVALMAALSMASAVEWQCLGIDGDGGGNICVGGGNGRWWMATEIATAMATATGTATAK